MLLLSVALMPAALVPSAVAASVTELPPFLTGDVGLAYGYDHLAGTIDEREPADQVDAAAADEGVYSTTTEWEVAHRSLNTHRLDYHLAFGAGPGVAVKLDLPQYVSSAVTYTSLQNMVFDPATGTGTYFGTDEGTPGTYVSGKGFGGVWLGVAGQPFSEAYTKRNNKATWLAEMAFRTGDKSGYWAVSDDGTRGAGPGGSAWRFHTAFSKRVGAAEPYISGTVTIEQPTTVVIASPDGLGGVILSGGEVTVNPANHGEIRAGTEVLAARNDVNGAQVALDIHLAANYSGYGDVVSGIYLPNVLDASLGTVVQQAESLEGGGGIALRWRPMEYMQIDLFGEMFFHMPQRLESPYNVYTWTDTTRALVGVDLTVRVRPQEKKTAPTTPGA